MYAEHQHDPQFFKNEIQQATKNSTLEPQEQPNDYEIIEVRLKRKNGAKKLDRPAIFVVMPINHRQICSKRVIDQSRLIQSQP